DVADEGGDAQVGERLQVARRPHQGPHLMAIPPQAPDEGAADVAGGTGQEDPHRAILARAVARARTLGLVIPSGSEGPGRREAFQTSDSKRLRATLPPGPSLPLGMT